MQNLEKTLKIIERNSNVKILLKDALLKCESLSNNHEVLNDKSEINEKLKSVTKFNELIENFEYSELDIVLILLNKLSSSSKNFV